MIGFLFGCLLLAPPSTGRGPRDPRHVAWGRRIRRARIVAGRSQEWVAREVGTSQAAVSRWELGITAPNSDQKVMLAGLFCREPDEMFPLVIPAEEGES